MKKPGLLILILCASCLLLSGCGLFDSEYVVIEDYAPATQSDNTPEETIKVRNINSLKRAISTIITDGATEGKIVFDPAYDGDPVGDMSKACWQVRTQDALCAYCVADISYELSKIVTYYEAKLSIGYTDYVDDAGSIVELSFSTGIETVIRQALDEGKTKIVLLVEHSSYSAEDVVNLVSEVYRQNPAVAPREPSVSVNMYSGSSMQRLYELNMRYGMTSEELQKRKAELRGFSPFADIERGELDDAMKARMAYDYLCANTYLDTSDLRNTVYDALIGNNAGSEGIALGYVELCRQLGLECMIVYGQHDWQSHCWNIIKADGVYYHVDAGLEQARNEQRGFMKTDEDFWATYRWDMSSYPACMPLPEPDEELLPEPEDGSAGEAEEEFADGPTEEYEAIAPENEGIADEAESEALPSSETEPEKGDKRRLVEPEDESLISSDAESQEN